MRRSTKAAGGAAGPLRVPRISRPQEPSTTSPSQVAAIFTPLVLVYQAWTYWVFRKRIAVHHIPETVLAARPR